MKSRLEDPKFIKKLKISFYISLAIFVAMGFFVDNNPHFWWEKVPAFFAIYGYFACVIIIFGAKALGRYWLQRKEDYYD